MYRTQKMNSRHIFLMMMVVWIGFSGAQAQQKTDMNATTGCEFLFRQEAPGHGWPERNTAHTAV
ncbi:MAG: hypothetical protein LBV26_06120 [Bacteroidales bacterium]|jgi:hypothetical protein|nr:hypothetical protein [Bacteroidales bacterium]